MYSNKRVYMFLYKTRLVIYLFSQNMFIYPFRISLNNFN